LVSGLGRAKVRDWDKCFVNGGDVPSGGAVGWRSGLACGSVIKVTSKLRNNVPPLGLDLGKKMMAMRRSRWRW